MTLDPAIGRLIVASFAIQFASAALHKLRDPKRFEQIFQAYRLLPEAYARRISWLVPALEIATAAALPWSRTRSYAGGIGIVLLAGYAVAMALNLLRGRRDIACGCGGPDDRRPIAAWMVWRNGVLALLLAAALLPWSERGLVATDLITIGCGVAAGIIVYRCLDRLGQVARSARALQGLP